MCGVAGVFSTRQIDKSDITVMTHQLLHRGPDAHGVFVNDDSTIALGHTRLAIIDLKHESNQPFLSGNKRFAVVFNGEIYNYRLLKKELVDRHHVHFRTSSDTEVIAEGFAVWGARLVDKLEGMFAIAIADLQSSSLFLFRDRIGKKPLYYFHSESVFAFASEIKSLLKHPVVASATRIRTQSIDTFLHLGYIPEPHTIYDVIKKFPAGHSAVVDKALNISLQPYWTIQEHIFPSTISSPELAKKGFDALLEKAVSSRLIADVPLGSFLSGGIDSSLVTAYASRMSAQKFRTFSIGFKESKFDESQYARAVAKALHTDHTEYTVSEQDALENTETYLDHFDEPFADTSAIPTMMVSKLARQQVKVVLTGDGGDELFQGYGAYNWADRLASVPWKMISPFLRLSFIVSRNDRLRRVSKLLKPVPAGESRSHIFSQEQYFFTQQEIRDRLMTTPEQFASFVYNDPVIRGRNMTAAELQALFDLQFYLRDDLLVKVDRASMLFALECRCPLLDHRIVEFAYSLHHTVKKRNGTSKWLLKEMLAPFLPPDLIHRPKWGFSVPLARWLKNDLSFLMSQYLSRKLTRDLGLFNEKYVELLKKRFAQGNEHLYNRLWLIIVLQRWLVKHNMANGNRS